MLWEHQGGLDGFSSKSQVVFKISKKEFDGFSLFVFNNEFFCF